MQIRNIALLVISTPLWVACATPQLPSEKSLTVQVQRQFSTILDKCQRLENVSVRGQGSMGFSLSALDIATINAQQKAREQVADAGGDTIVFTTRDVVSVVAGTPAVATVQVQGVGFRCKS